MTLFGYLAPMGLFLADPFIIPECTTETDDSGVNSSSALDMGISDWIRIFAYYEERLSNAFTAAAFLANKAWMESNL